MSCTDCQKNCPEPLSSDQCIRYTGEDVPALGICASDYLNDVEGALIQGLLGLVNGTGITLPALTLDCSLLTGLIASDKNLLSILQAYEQALCSLKASVDTLTAPASPLSLDTACLTGLPASPSQVQILQALLVKTCALDSRLGAVEADYVKASQLPSLITSILSPTGSSVIIQETTRMPKYVALPYHGPLSAFDSSGKGLASQGYDRVYICNGQTVNGFTTPDYRGYSPIGANYGLPGGALPAAVDPALPANAGYTLSPGTKKGSLTHPLSLTELPAHQHTITDQGHNHDVPVGAQVGADARDNGVDRKFNPHYTGSVKTAPTYTGILINPAGGDQPHNNLQPSLATVFIMYIP